ncbi:triacylglycerol lipase [Ancylostoma duodenale]|uniref:Triacylglycerol lipase n=1 Tax=Ancylostoma duodenale TaxID=51022 RepID=A0A0C2GTR0_9BILA|nr:triacylglycerol lipase [Ancylostoma duodenale]
MIALLVLSLATLCSCANYTDEFARKIMFPIAAAAYSDHAWMCMANNLLGKLHHQVTVKCDGGLCSGFTAVLDKHKAIAVSFRGTQGMLQLFEEAKQSAMKSWSVWAFGGQVSKYFKQAFFNIWDNGMRADFKALREKYPDYEVWMTGHSLGGAIASLAASYVVGTKMVNQTMVKLLTFGQPRVGDWEFADMHDEQIKFAYRVVRWRDLVPQIPSSDFYGYYHQGTEVFYTTSMYPRQFVICEPRGENKECSATIWSTSIDDHLVYFGKTVSEYGKNGCYE